MPTNWPAGTPAPVVNGIVDPAVSLIDLTPLSWTPPLPPGTPSVNSRCAASPEHSNRSVKFPTTGTFEALPLATLTSSRCAPGPASPVSPFGPIHAGSLARQASPLSPFGPIHAGSLARQALPFSPFGPAAPLVPGSPCAPAAPV